MNQIELLHHYTATTCVALNVFPESLDLWRVAIPKIAFSNPFLLHGILCLAACHIWQSPSPGQDLMEYDNIAKAHYTTALSTFCPMLDQINEQNAAPVVAFSMLVVLLSMGMPPSNSSETMTPLSYAQYMAGVIRLVRGVRQVLDECTPFIKGSLFTPILDVDHAKDTEALGFEAEAAMRYIEQRIHSDISPPSLRNEYLEATRFLRDCNPRRNLEVEHQTIILAWPAMIPAHFFEEIQEGKPIAVAIFMFFGVLLDILRFIWWSGDKGKKNWSRLLRRYCRAVGRVSLCGRR